MVPIDHVEKSISTLGFEEGDNHEQLGLELEESHRGTKTTFFPMPQHFEKNDKNNNVKGWRPEIFSERF
jgi:hypothetical protein